VLRQLDEAGRFALDGIAQRMPELHHDETLALPGHAQDEFDTLVARCRHRDRLASLLPSAFGHSDGVKALFKGPSGTGKTLAARHLAHALSRPLYRVDLAATVSKYIGETERNLERVFEAAESLDVVLLLDEGDALMAGRTQVGSATDRYANLETNYLLQRLERYRGVMVVTTNAADRIDAAFTRRMDATLDFPLPDALTRLALWQAHLGGHVQVPDQTLERVALRCHLSGGQIRNAALHAALLAIERARTIGPGELQQALEREYRKAGQQCPSLEPQD
jgi:SpoVK/Ycf46/Vps4 family AAA+-type ATPase